MRKLFTIVFILFAISGCARQYTLPTQSGLPEVLIDGKTTDYVSDFIVNDAINHGGHVIRSDKYQLVLARPGSPGQNNWYGTHANPTTELHTFYNIISQSDSVRVIATGLAIVNPGSGYYKNVALSSRNVPNLQRDLERIKSSINN